MSTHCGWIKESGDWDTLYIDNDPVSELAGDWKNQFVQVRYYVSDTRMEPETIKTVWTEHVLGIMTAKYNELWGSDWTGQYGMDETCVVGDHDLLKELRSYIGKWVVLEITLSEKQ